MPWLTEEDSAGCRHGWDVADFYNPEITIDSPMPCIYYWSQESMESSMRKTELRREEGLLATLMALFEIMRC